MFISRAEEEIIQTGNGELYSQPRRKKHGLENYVLEEKITKEVLLCPA